MLLENPAVALNIGIQDILDILESTLREKNWKNFEMASLKLVYVPHYIFNYDALVEQDVQGQVYSQGFSGAMVMNAINGHLEPVLNQILEQQPVNYEKEVSHELQFELLKPAITPSEAPNTARLKLAGQFQIGKDSVTCSGFRLVYWPVWHLFVSLPNKKTQKVDIEAVSGYSLNWEEVPEREKGWLEVTSDTLAKMKTPGGWAELSKKAVKVGAGGVKAAATKSASPEGGRSIVQWLTQTKIGQYTILLIILMILVLIFFT